MKNNPLEIPYRLETIEDVHQAVHGELVSVTDYQKLLLLADKTALNKPPALMKAKKKASKEFVKFNIDEKKIREVKIDVAEVAHLPLLDQYPLIRQSIPWMNDIIRHPDLFCFFHTFPLEIRKRFELEHLPATPLPMYSAVMAIRRLIKRELIVYVKAQKTSVLNPAQLKNGLVALTVFDPRNEDILTVLKKEKQDGDNPLHQNAMAELLFARLPKTIQELLTRNANSMIPKLSLKMSGLNLSSRHIMNLMGYLKPNMTSDDLYKTLNKIDGVAAKMSIPEESRSKLHHYIESMKKNIDRAPAVYRTLFLNPGLETFQKLHRPAKVMEAVATVTEKTVRHYTKAITLDFYPTKDFFDLIKGKFSSDCTDSRLGEKQLMTPFFFNIRIFKGPKWIGNIYMLDFCAQHDTLIIDRIQIPRERKALYHRFFECLKDVLIEIFEDVRYRYILMPLRISNHAAIQKTFNQYKNHLEKKAKDIETEYADRFESLDGRKTYYVLHQRSSI
ncbi:MAG: hypothetical protein QUS13_07885 [Smithella sp.]|nr:hypothetical protein [Smithella sp.]